ncbi:MAG: acyl-CoA desaturase [Holophaga sp.]|nr:acyl-CoA desaturase [Holophaga sp.]
MTQSRRWNPLNTPFLIGTLVLAVVLVPLNIIYSKALLFELIVSLGMFIAIGLSVAMGYHRLFSHRSYRASWPLRLVLLCFGAAAFQNSALRWASDHRLHHRFVDTERDPYSIRKGFWHAHWIWVMESTSHPLEGVTDLQADPLVRWQDRYFFRIGAVVSLIPVAIGFATDNVWGHLIMGLILRIVLTHHTTFLINSAAHAFGTQPYTDTNTARDNGLLAPFTFGEGYHNFHHMWPGDYRNGIRWYQWDTAKWLIKAFSWVGMADKLRRVPETVIQRAKLAMEEKRLAARLIAAPPSVAEDLRARLASARLRMDHALVALQEQRESLKTHHQEWKIAMLTRRAEVRMAWAEWKAARFLVRNLA